MKRLLRNLCYLFDLTDFEYIRGTFGSWPFRFFITVWEPRRRWNWHRKLFPWRLRCCLAGLLLSWMYSTCTKCGRKFSMRELWWGREQAKLIQFMSGSICHERCPDEGFK